MATMTFDDEFNTFNTTTWEPDWYYWPNGSASGTSSWQEVPADVPADGNTFSDTNGVLSLKIIPTPADVNPSSVGNEPFLGSLMTTHGSFSQLYGYFEANITLPTAQGVNLGNGFSSAFWLLPENGAWPPELDIFENDSSQGNSLETGVFTNETGTTQQFYNWDYNLSAGAHTFAVDWEATTITWYIDNKQVFQTATPSDLNTPMYMVLDNMANAPGGWNGNPTAGTTTSMQVNWVHVYTSNPYTNGSTGGTGGSSGTSGGGGGSSGGNGAILIKPGSGSFTDTAGNIYTIDSSDNALENGQLMAGGSGTGEMELYNATVYGEDAGSGTWYTWNQSTWVPATTAPPAPTTGSSGTGSSAGPADPTVGSGSDTLVLNISEDAYANGDGTSDAAGDAIFTVSVDGKQLAGTFTAQASHSAKQDQTFTIKGNWAPGTHTVGVDFLNDAYAGTPSTDRNLYVDSVTYDGTNTGQSASMLSSGTHNFSVTDSTAVPPAVVGSGADTLVVKVSEDYYLGNAQFTVAVDGKQLGGTFTATTLHSSGGSQAFYFAGDFGTGQHTVKVAFLNDAYAGSPSLDRNLYINDIIYNGTDTGDSHALMSNGSSSFTVTGGTAPSVTETGDHGSLQKNLSQTGTYTVGSDSFVLGSGNTVSATLGSGTSNIAFVGPSSLTLTGGSGSATVTADSGNNTFTAGSGSLDVTGGGGTNSFVFHSGSGMFTVEDFSVANGDKLNIDTALKSAMVAKSDGEGGTLLTFGSANTHAIDLHGLAAAPTSAINWS